MDDDDSGVFTAGAIVTVTVILRRRTMGEVYETTLQEGELTKVEGVQEKEEEPAAVVAVSYHKHHLVYKFTHFNYEVRCLALWLGVYDQILILKNVKILIKQQRELRQTVDIKKV